MAADRRNADRRNADPKHDKLLTALRAGRWFSAIPEPMQRALVEAAQVKTLTENERLFARGDPPSGMWAALEGSLRVSSIAEDGRESILTIVEPPQWFGEIAVFDGQPRTHDCFADEEARVLFVPQRALDELLSREPAWWRALALLVTGKLRLAFLFMEDHATQPVAARLARRLLWMAEGYGEWRDRRMRVIDVRQEQLASMLSTSRQTVNALLKELEGRGAIKLAYGKVEVVDVEKLRAASGG